MKVQLLLLSIVGLVRSECVSSPRWPADIVIAWDNSNTAGTTGQQHTNTNAFLRLVVAGIMNNPDTTKQYNRVQVLPFNNGALQGWNTLLTLATNSINNVAYSGSGRDYNTNLNTAVGAFDYTLNNTRHVIVVANGFPSIQATTAINVLKGRGVNVYLVTHPSTLVAASTWFNYATAANSKYVYYASNQNYDNYATLASVFVGNFFNSVNIACRVTGTGNVVTFDGATLDVHNTGVFRLAQISNIEVQGLFAPCYAQASVSCLLGVSLVDPSNLATSIQFYGTPGSYSLDVAQKSGLNDVPVSSITGLTVQTLLPEGAQFATYNPSGASFPPLTIKTSPLGLSLRIGAAASYLNVTVGVCGNFNTCGDDDGNTFLSTNAEAYRVDSVQVGFGLNNVEVAALNLPNVTSSVKTEFAQSSNQDCGSLSKSLVALCNQDVSQTASVGIGADYKEIVSQECQIYCQASPFQQSQMSSLVVADDCTQYCSKVQLTSALNLPALNGSNADAATPPFFLSSVKSNNISVLNIPEVASGQYCLNTSATDVFQRTLKNVTFIRISCEGSASSNLTLNADDVNIVVDPKKPDFTVQMTSSVSDSSRVRKQLWRFLSLPITVTTTPLIAFSTGFRPRFSSNKLGPYVLQWVVYDGCNYLTKNVTVTVGCPASDQSNFPLAFINNANVLFMQGSSPTFQASNLYGLSIITGDVNPTYAWNLTWDTLPSPLNASWTTATSVMIQIPAARQMINQSTSYGSSSWVPGPSQSVVQPYINPTTGYTVIGFSSTISNTTNVTTQPYNTTQYYISTVAKNICKIDFNSFTLSQFQPTFTDQVPGGCASIGKFYLKSNVTNQCGSFVDTMPVEVTCGPPPFAMINHCGAASTCNLNEVPSKNLPSSVNLVHNYQYGSSNFPSQSLSSTETYDRFGRTLVRAWNVSTSFVTANTASNYLSTLVGNTASLTAIEPGTYVVSLNVTAGGCATSVDTVTVTAQCTAACSVPLEFVGGVSTYVSVAGGNVTATSTVSNTTCYNLKSYRYVITQFPSMFYDGNYVSFLGLPTSVQSSQFTATGYGNPVTLSNYMFNQPWGGTYQMSLIASDGCIKANNTKAIVVTCPYALSTAVINGVTTVSDVGGTFPVLNYTGSVNKNGNPATIQYRMVAQLNGVNVGSPLVSTTPSYVFTPSVAGSYNVSMIAHDGCQYVKTNVIVAVTCSSIAVTPVVSLVSVSQAGLVNVTYGPLDSTTTFLTKTWTVNNPAGSAFSFSTWATGITFTPSAPGAYVVKLVFSNGCGSQSVAGTLSYDNPKSYSIVLSSTYTSSPILAVAANGRGFPQINIDANTSVITGTGLTYASVYGGSYWYVKSAPSDSVLKTYVVNTYSSYGSNLISSGSYVDVGVYNSTSTVQQLVIRNSTVATVTTQTVLSKLSVVCDGTNLPAAGLFSACFRPDVAGTYVLQLKVAGLYSDTYELSTPVTVIASCASNQAISQLTGQALTGADSLIAPRRFTVEASQVFTDLTNMQGYYNWVIYGSTNTYVPYINTTTNATQYQEVPVANDVSTQVYRVNRYSKTISYVASRNFSNWVLSLTANTGCQYQTVNNSVPIAFAPSNFGANKITARGSARYFGQDILDGGIAMAYVVNPDKRVGLQLEVTVDAGVVIASQSVTFGKCTHPALLVAASNPSGLNAGQIAGIVIGSILGVAFLGAAGFFVYRKYVQGGGSSKA